MMVFKDKCVCAGQVYFPPWIQTMPKKKSELTISVSCGTGKNLEVYGYGLPKKCPGCKTYDDLKLDGESLSHSATLHPTWIVIPHNLVCRSGTDRRRPMACTRRSIHDMLPP